MCETIEEFFSNNFCDVIVKDNKTECIMTVECKNLLKDFCSFNSYIDKKVNKLKEKGLFVECEFNWINHNDWDDEYIATIKIYYEDYDE